MMPDDYLVLYNVARTFALLGDIPGALDRLEQAFNVQPAIQRRLAAWLPLDQDLDALRIEPRFCALKDRVTRELSAIA
jgi:hypothetical protein